LQENNDSQNEWYQKNWVITLFLIFIAPVGIFLLWKYTHYGHKTKIFISLVFGLIFAGNLVAQTYDEPNITPPQPVTTQQQNNLPSTPPQDITPPPQPVTTQQQNNLPSKISVLPSIGATREEFGKTFKAYSGNGSDYVRYNNDGILVMFDGDRAISVTLQPLAENNYLGGINPRDFLPSDTVQVEEKKVGITYEAKASSKLLEQVYPKSKGKFGAGAMYKENGDVISVTISIGH